MSFTQIFAVGLFPLLSVTLRLLLVYTKHCLKQALSSILYL